MKWVRLTEHICESFIETILKIYEYSFVFEIITNLLNNFDMQIGVLFDQISDFGRINLF